ncbi:MAG: glutamate racemase [Thermincola sp.]|nr:glutamate racemase [Thermincola sp.]MDT3703921.1 glutamate racemase [Thermincola sp.]
MNNEHKLLPIGVFDSGIGGISVLSDMLRTLPNERFIYAADSANAPYGTKTQAHVRELSLKVANMIVDKGVKALVVACNTATSAAITSIRERYTIPVIGMEPAVKPAVENGRKGKIVVMATPLTLKEEKFNSLFNRYSPEVPILPLPCGGLAELIEGEDQEEIKKYLQKLWANISMSEVSSVVLGCTHYCFIKRDLQEIIGPEINIVDGNAGTVRHLVRILTDGDLLSETSIVAPIEERVHFLATGQDSRTFELCKRFLQKCTESQMEE